MPRLLVGLLSLLATAAMADTRIDVTRHFDLHSDPWLNLHHFLYQWARADEGIGEGREAVTVPERGTRDDLGPAERETWDAALRFYRRNVARRSHFDDAMLAQKFALLRLGGALDGRPESEISGIGEVLVRAMPVYVDSWWPVHDENNRRWVANLVEALRASERRFVALTGRLYGAGWPDEPRRIDVSAYANFRAGYTALGHVVIYASDPGNQHLYGLETLYHEVHHAREISRPTRAMVGDAFAQRQTAVPPNLSHGIFFGTAGAFVVSVADEFGAEPHEPYWRREGFADFATWRDVFLAVNAYWLPAVDGTVTSSEALDAIAGYFDRRD